MINLINQMTAQMTAQMAMPATAPTPAPKMATSEKYEEGRAELPAFLTNIDLYCYRHNVPNNQDKILAVRG